MPRWMMKPKIKTALPLAMVLILWQLASMAVSPLFVPAPRAFWMNLFPFLQTASSFTVLSILFGVLQPPACLPPRLVCPSVAGLLLVYG